ncbi:MAG TPA: hypothetical protein VLM79_31155, partial [Kofleriaceae bacterium]|nr:hypothetical protein [Kofleriaceae bacterium]
MSTTEVGRRPTSGKPDSTPRDGVSLEAVIEADRRLDELSCARLLGNVAELVHAAQKAGQPLGTVTPASIVVSPDGSAKLAPGVASLRYTAPERLRGGAGDRRTDVFALGAVLWEVLAHERLFDGSDDAAVKRAVLERAIPAPSELNANVPAELDAICKRALARDPADRYQSARVMAAEIDAVLGNAGYPESNDQFAAYLARAFAAPAAAAASPASPAPAAPPAPPAPAPAAAAERPAAPTGRSAPTLPPPPLKPAARVSPDSGPVAAPKPTSPPPAPTPAPTSPPPFAPTSTMLGGAPSAAKTPAPAAESSASKSPLPTTTMLGNATGALGRSPAAPEAPARPPSTTRPPLTSAAPATTVVGSIPGSSTGASPLTSTGASPLTSTGASPLTSTSASPLSQAGASPHAAVGASPFAPAGASALPPAGASPFAPAIPENTLPGAAPLPTRPPLFGPATQASAPAGPTGTPGNGPLAATPGTLASFPAPPRPPAPPTILGSPGAPPSAPSPSVTAPFGSQAISADIIEPAFKPVAMPASAP